LIYDKLVISGVISIAHMLTKQFRRLPNFPVVHEYVTSSLPNNSGTKIAQHKIHNTLSLPGLCLHKCYWLQVNCKIFPQIQSPDVSQLRCNVRVRLSLIDRFESWTIAGSKNQGQMASCSVQILLKIKVDKRNARPAAM